MRFGLNQNIMYKGVVYHVQTEDGGNSNPVITTHLFKDGGTIFASRRANYGDKLDSENLDEAVKEMMRSQTIAILKDLKAGLFDEALTKKG